jgi:phosphoenolpyruvate carboxykinase (GTP)
MRRGAHPNSRFTTALANVPNLAADYDDPKGVPIDAIIFGGRARDREPLIRAITDLAEGVYDGLTLGAEATFAAEGVEGLLRYDPMSMRPLMSYPEGAYAADWLKIIGSAASQPIFAHVNWFQRDPEDGHYLWPGYRDNLRQPAARCCGCCGSRRARSGAGRRFGIIPAIDELDLDGVIATPEDLETILSIDTPRWKQEMKYREQDLQQFSGLPEEIWQAHRRSPRLSTTRTERRGRPRPDSSGGPGWLWGWRLARPGSRFGIDSQSWEAV